MNRKQFGELLKDEQAHPIALMRGLVRLYGIDWMQWLPSVVRRVLDRDLDVSMANINVHKIMAAAAVGTRVNFWESWEHFHFLVQALNNNVPEHRVHQTLTVAQMMVAVDIAMQIRRELGKLSYVPEFEDEVAKYVAAQAKENGIWYLPPPLDFAARFAAGRRYECLDCGNDSEIHFDDGLCDVCVERFDTSHLGSWKPNPELVAKGWGRNIRIYEKNPTAKVKARLEQVLSNPHITLQETSTDVCVARLLVALQYVGYRRKQLAEQSS